MTKSNDKLSQDRRSEPEGSVRLRFRLAIRACTLLVLSLVSCTIHTSAGEPLAADPRLEPARIEGDIEVWAWNIAAASLEELVPWFNEIYPNVQVNVNMTGANMLVRLMLALSAGMGAPDVSQIEIFNVPRFARTGRLTDLTPVASQYEDRFPAGAWANCVLDGRVYAIPWGAGPCAVYYKRDLFDRYGIDPDTIETWDDYIEAGRKIVEQSGGRTKMLFLASNDLMSMLQILMQQNGAQVFDDQGRIVVTSPKVLQAMNVLKRLLESGISANTQMYSHAHYASFTSDTVATYPMAAWFGGTIKDHSPQTAGNWGVFRLPALEPGGLRTSSYGGSVLIIPDQCTNKEAAWAYIEYVLCTEKAQIQQYRSFDLIPVLLTTYDDPFFDEPDPFYGGQKVRRLFSLDIDKIPVLNRTKDWRETTRYIAQSLSGWVEDGLYDPEEMLDKLAHRLSHRLRREIAPETVARGSGE